MNIQCNALAYAQQLEAAGVPRGQALVHANTLAHVLSDCAASPADLNVLRGDFAHQLAETETRLRAEIIETEARLRSEIKQSECRLGERIGRLEDQMSYMKWMNALTLALLIGLIVKSSFV